jgi:hypothetical protein
MAKGNVFMGTLKGRVGDTVFYVKQGEQNAIKYQRNISNPQSAPQMYQRSRFLAANKFYTRGRQAFFKFAYENKRKGESDFNAFMRENIGEAPNITRDAFYYYNYPIVGHFKVSNGSLPTILCREGNSGWQANLGISYPSTSISTVGELSALMIADGRYQVGDIITLLFIDAHTSIGVPSLKPSQLSYAYGTPEWKIIQFKVNTLDVTHLTDMGLWYARETTGELVLIGDEDTDFLPSSSICAFTCVHSRQTRSRLKVSTQQLYINNLAQQADDAQREDEYIAEVIADWRTPAEVPVKSEVILKGSLTSSSSTTPVTGVTIETVEGSVFGLDGNAFVASEYLAPGTNYDVGVIRGSGINAAQMTVISGTANVTFTQQDADEVLISVETVSRVGDDAFSVGMLISGQPIPIAAAVYTVAGSHHSLEDLTTVTSVDEDISGFSDGDGVPVEGSWNIAPPAEEESYSLFRINAASGVTLSASDFTCDNTQGSIIIEFTRSASNQIFVNATVPAGTSETTQRVIRYYGDPVATINVIIS